MKPFQGDWQTFIDTIRCFGLFLAFSEAIFFAMFLFNKGLRKNRAWMWTAVTMILVDYSIAYTEWDRIGDPVGIAGRLWANTALLITQALVIKWSFNVKGTKEKTLFEQFWRTRHET